MKSLKKLIGNRKSITFLDLEGTQFSHEMIAIGAVKVDIRKDLSIRKIHKGYHSLVIAKNKIGKVVTDLTGITENNLKEKGKPFRVIINELKKYLGFDFTRTLFVTFGNHDLRIIAQSLAHNMDAPKEDVRLIIKHSFDLAEFISRYIRDENNNTYSLAHMLEVFKVEFKGTQHDPMADALNLAYLYEAFLKNPEIVKEKYKIVLKNNRHLPEPMNEVVASLLKGETITPEYFEKLLDDSFSKI